MPCLHYKLKFKVKPTNFQVSSLTSKLLNVICSQVPFPVIQDEHQQFYFNYLVVKSESYIGTSCYTTRSKNMNKIL